ncbi:hypothetical protein [Thorsellia anophelis]|uniref:Uncharacterized protein n=1 Tax=Thorsellia anophelis DSM 18579 TaxID=1123402 RepID=A0A1I0ENZ2_9GAMM|nr:hypothetical protein [Thorsellia anophelis]SET47210.1 hypothetical protein SAMN02583745_02474 [Thorsellia anophelis DSM 18579]
MKKFKRIDINLAKNAFQVYTFEHAEIKLINKKLSRAESWYQVISATELTWKMSFSDCLVDPVNNSI